MPHYLGIELAILLSIIIVALVGLMIWMYGLTKTKVPFIPVAPHMLDPIIGALCLVPGSKLYDLGSGDARVLLAILKRRPDIIAVGIESAPLPRLFAFVRRSFDRNRARLKLSGKDFFAADLSDATHIFLFLFPAIMEKLEPKLERELRPGTRVVSCDFAFPGRTPDEEIAIPGTHLHGRRLLVYTF